MSQQEAHPEARGGCLPAAVGMGPPEELGPCGAERLLGPQPMHHCRE